MVETNFLYFGLNVMSSFLIAQLYMKNGMIMLPLWQEQYLFGT